jgi:hypothetical protein
MDEGSSVASENIPNFWQLLFPQSPINPVQAPPEPNNHDAHDDAERIHERPMGVEGIPGSDGFEQRQPDHG